MFIFTRFTSSGGMNDHLLSTRSNLRWTSLLWTMTITGMGLSGCQTEPVECVSDPACGTGMLCVNTRCVGPTVEGEPYETYTSELHLRLAAQCGICHGVSGGGPTSQAQGTPMNPDVNEPATPAEDTPSGTFDPFALPNLPVALGDSAWRIYMDSLNEGRLRASYEDTAQFLNQETPDESLLLAYGRGEIWITPDRLHPTLYNPKINVSPERSAESMEGQALEMGDAEATPTPEVAQLSLDTSYERVRSWSGLDHSTTGRVYTLQLKAFQDGPQDVIASVCGSCHATPLPEPGPFGGFVFEASPQTSSALAVLRPLINPQEPASSALIRMAFGEYEHEVVLSAEADERQGFSERVIEWIQRVSPAVP